MISRQTAVRIRSSAIAILCFLGFWAFASIQAAPCGQAGNEKVEPEKKPLRYRLIVLKPTVCLNEGIELELELENTATRNILIDPRALLHTVNISRDGGAIVPTGDLWGKVPRDQLVALKPGESYRKTIMYSLKNTFFSVTGIYTIRVSYGQFADLSHELPNLYKGAVDSNAVLFEINDCG